MMLVTDLAVLDHTDGTVLLIANAVRRRARTRGYDDAVARLDAMAARPDQGRAAGRRRRSSRPTPPRCRSNTGRRALRGRRRADPRAHPGRRRVPGRARQRFEPTTDVDALDLYRVLRATNPSPYMYLLRFAGRESPFDVVGSSPEALVTVTGTLGRRAPAGRHPAARRDAGGGRPAGRRAAAPTPRSGPST